MDGLVLKPGVGDKKLVIRAEIKQSLTIAIAVTQAMWTNYRPPRPKSDPTQALKSPRTNSMSLGGTSETTDCSLS